MTQSPNYSGRNSGAGSCHGGLTPVRESSSGDRTCTLWVDMGEAVPLRVVDRSQRRVELLQRRVLSSPERIDERACVTSPRTVHDHPPGSRRRSTVDAARPVQCGACALALRAGVHPKVVSDRLGQATIAVTIDTYSHVVPSLDAEAADTVAADIFGSSA